MLKQIKTQPFGFLMFLLGQFTLWPQAIRILEIHSAYGISLTTSIVGLAMSLCSCIYCLKSSNNMFWFTLDSISNLLAGSIILFLKFYF